MTYKNHFLTNVILRVDFIASEANIKNHLDKDVYDICKSYFPIAEERKLQTQQVLVSNNPEVKDTIVNTENLSEWHFFDLKREKELCITDKNMFVDYRVYNTFDELKDPYMEILTSLLKTYKSIGIKRVGLRYIDQINMEYSPTTNWFDYWKDYISEDLLHGLCITESQDKIARHMNSIEMNYGTHNLRFQYGIFNSDYPAPNKKNQFILDTDVYNVGVIDKDDFESVISIFHNESKKWFEKSITENLRNKMGKE